MATTTTEKPRVWHLHDFRSSDIFVLLVISAAVFTDIFLYGVLVPVIPFALHERVGVPQKQVARWNGILLALFNLGLCVGSPVFGFVADRAAASRRLPFLSGLLTLSGATLLLCLSRRLALFALGRALQGLSAAICWAVGLALLADRFGDRMGWAAGWVNWAMNAGFLLSPILGGLAYDRAGYYAVYYMGFGLLACDVILRLAMAEARTTRNTQDTARSVIVPAESAIMPGRADDTESGLPDGSLQPRKRNPYISLLTSSRLLAALLGCMMQSASKYAFFAVVPLFVHDTFHWNSLGAGVILLCVLVPGFLSPLVGILSDKYGAKWLSTLGFLLSVPTFVCLRFVNKDTLRQKVLFGALLALMGVALALSSTPLMAEITYVIKDKEKRQPGIWGQRGVFGVGFGLFTTAFALGGVVGSFMGGSLYQGRGWAAFGWGFGVWCAVGAAVCALFVGSSNRIRIR